MTAVEFLWRHADALLLFGPLAVGVLLMVAPAGRISTATSAIVACAAAVFALVLVIRVLGGATLDALDPFGAGAVAVAGVVTAAAFLAAFAYSAAEFPHRTRTIALGLGLVVAGAAFGAMMERDLLRMALLLQCATLAGAALTGLAVERDRRAALAAFGAVVTALGAGALALSGIALLHAAAGALDVGAIAANVSAPGAASGAWLGAALSFVALCAFTGLVPLHGVAASSAARTAQASAPLVMIVLRLAGFVALVRVYAVTQAFAAPELAQAFAYGAATIGALSLVVGGLQAIGAADARRLAAHALTAQFGCALIGLAAGGDDGAIAALFVAAAGVMTALALVIGAGVARAGVSSTPMATLDGLGKTHPFVAAAITIAALGMTGAPLTASFLGKWLSIEAALARGWYWAAAAVVASSFAAVFVAGQIVERLYFRDRAVAFGAAPRTAYAVAPALVVAALATLVFGWNAEGPLDAARMAAAAMAAAGAAAGPSTP